MLSSVMICNDFITIGCKQIEKEWTDNEGDNFLIGHEWNFK